MLTSISITHVNIHEHHSCQLASKASFIEFQLRELQLQKLYLQKLQLQKLHLQSFTYKASVQGIQIPHSNNRHFGPYLD
ncbi:hypothetical protein COP2_023150 [Malus domestica]